MLQRFPGTDNGRCRSASDFGQESDWDRSKHRSRSSSIPVLLIEGDNRAGLGYVIVKAVADSAINMSFLRAQVVGRKYGAVFGFENDADATKAATLVTRVAATACRR